MSINCMTTVEWTNIVGIFMHWNTSAFSNANSKLYLHTIWMDLINIMLHKRSQKVIYYMTPLTHKFKNR